MTSVISLPWTVFVEVISTLPRYASLPYETYSFLVAGYGSPRLHLVCTHWSSLKKSYKKRSSLMALMKICVKFYNILKFFKVPELYQLVIVCWINDIRNLMNFERLVRLKFCDTPILRDRKVYDVFKSSQLNTCISWGPLICRMRLWPSRGTSFVAYLLFRY